MKRLLFLGLMACLSFALKAQTTKETRKFGIKFSGFVKTDLFVDTRQTVSAREGHFLLWPAATNLDNNGEDINEQINTNFLSLQSRLSGKITGPDAFGAKTSGLIEGDFFAQKNDNTNLFRLRHAFIKLNWEKSELLVGQYWNPLFITSCFPSTVSFNTGVPIIAFSRNPQVRFTHQLGSFKIIAAAQEQRDYTTRGEKGATSDYLRNAGIPDLHLQLHAQHQINATTKLDYGLGAETKWIKPRLVSANNYKVDETLNSKAAVAFLKVTTKPITFKTSAIYGENTADAMTISGFAVKDVVDSATGEQSYTPLTNTSLWADIHTNGKKWQAGIFAGVLKNNGAKDDLSETTNAVYGLGTNIKQLTRISPRLTYTSGKVKVGFEWERTEAKIGNTKERDLKGLPTSFDKVANNRFLTSIYYFF